MKPRDLAFLLRSAAAAIETPKDLNSEELLHVVEDLTVAADEITRERPIDGQTLAAELQPIAARLHIMVLEDQAAEAVALLPADPLRASYVAIWVYALLEEDRNVQFIWLRAIASRIDLQVGNL